MTASNQILVLLDLIKGVIALICGNLALPPLVRYLIGLIQPAFLVIMDLNKIISIGVLILITIYCFHKIDNKIIKALVAIFLFVPVLLMLLSFYTVLKVPLPF